MANPAIINGQEYMELIHHRLSLVAYYRVRDGDFPEVEVFRRLRELAAGFAGTGIAFGRVNMDLVGEEPWVSMEVRPYLVSPNSQVEVCTNRV